MAKAAKVSLWGTLPQQKSAKAQYSRKHRESPGRKSRRIRYQQRLYSWSIDGRNEMHGAAKRDVLMEHQEDGWMDNGRTVGPPARPPARRPVRPPARRPVRPPAGPSARPTDRPIFSLKLILCIKDPQNVDSD